MPHSFVIPQQVTATAIALLRDDLGLAATVNRDYEDDFGGGKGTVVNVRVPATLKARRRALDAGTAIVLDNITENTIPVTLDTMVYSAVPITDEDLSLRIEDFARQIIRPQVIAMVEDIENAVVAEMQALPETTTIDYVAATPVPTFTRARKYLRDLGVSPDGLWAACGTGVYAELQDAKAITDVTESGSTDALRNANVGRVRGFNTVENNRLDDDEIVFYSRDAFTLAVRAPRVPEGVAFGEARSENGFALRWIRDYDSSILQDRSIFSTFLGTQAMVVKRLAADGTVSQFTPALRIKTSTRPV
jgi:hypothetical protein